MQLAHRVQLVPTCRQADYFSRAAGTARFVWNWALGEWHAQLTGGEQPSGSKLKQQFNEIKYIAFPWLLGVHRDAHAQPFSNLHKAFVKFFNGVGGRPRFKKKGKCRDAFYVANDKLRISGKRVQLPKIGWVKLREALRFPGKILSAVVSRTADHWYISVTVDVPDELAARQRTADGVVGVDVGVKHAAVLSTGEKLEGPTPLKSNLRRLRIQQRRLARKVKDSKNYQKQAAKLARLHERIACIRQDFWHKLSARLCRENQAIGVEHLNVRGMLQNRRLSRAVLDSGFSALRPMLAYKSRLYGTAVVEADPFFPSSKTCSACGEINADLTLGTREWQCVCGATHDRDINAARNLATLALPATSGEVTPVRDDCVHEAHRGRNRSKSAVVSSSSSER